MRSIKAWIMVDKRFRYIIEFTGILIELVRE
jgi:hypothetical protein